MQRPIRKITNGSGQKIIGLFYSHKMGTHVPFESVPERNFYFWLEFDKTIRAYLSQPATIEYVMDEKIRRYTPDVEVQFYGFDVRPKFLEIKPQGIAEYRENSRRFAFIEEAFDELGADFEIITAEVIETQPRLTNLQRLYTYADQHVSTNARSICQDILESDGAPFKYVADQLNIAGYTLHTLYALIFQGWLTCDLDTQIDRDTVVRLLEGGVQ